MNKFASDIANTQVDSLLASMQVDSLLASMQVDSLLASTKQVKITNVIHTTISSGYLCTNLSPFWSDKNVACEERVRWVAGKFNSSNYLVRLQQNYLTKKSQVVLLCFVLIENIIRMNL